MAEWCGTLDVEILAYCLMPNHVHLIAVPQSADGLRRAIGEVHRRYTRMINFREEWRGHLWQGRFASFVLDEPYLLTAARYVELNPVRARLVRAPSRYRWSSAAAHVRGKDSALVRLAPRRIAPTEDRTSPRRHRYGIPESKAHFKHSALGPSRRHPLHNRSLEDPLNQSAYRYRTSDGACGVASVRQTVTTWLAPMGIENVSRSSAYICR